MSSNPFFSGTPLKHALRAYSVTAGTLLVAAAGVQAGVVYTDVNPDKVVDTDFDGFYLDFNNDGKNDFWFLHQEGTGTTSSGAAFINYNVLLLPFNNNSMLGSQLGNAVLPLELDTGYQVGTAGYWYSPRFGFVANFGVVGSNSNFFGNFDNSKDKYIGLRFKIGNNVHYGWIRLDVDTLATGFTIKDFAYDDEANASITVGDTGPPPLSGVKINEEPDVSLYSFSNTIYFNSSDPDILGAQIEVLDLHGRLIYSDRYTGGQKNIAMNMHAAGIYIVAIHHKMGVIQRKVFIQ